jgi:hypothetical protein
MNSIPECHGDSCVLDNFVMPRVVSPSHSIGCPLANNVVSSEWETGTRRKFYSVMKGFRPGIYLSWNNCRKPVEGFSGQEFKSFKSLKEAERYMCSF